MRGEGGGKGEVVSSSEKAKGARTNYASILMTRDLMESAKGSDAMCCDARHDLLDRHDEEGSGRSAWPDDMALLLLVTTFITFAAEMCSL